jgi:hypothetical protein
MASIRARYGKIFEEIDLYLLSYEIEATRNGELQPGAIRRSKTLVTGVEL